MIQQTFAGGITNGSTISLNLIFDNVQNDGPVVAFWELGVYINSISNANLIYPYHADSTVDLSQWQILAPYGVLVPDIPPSFVDFTTVQTQDRQRITLRNISAGTVDMYFAARVRYTFNRG